MFVKVLQGTGLTVKQSFFMGVSAAAEELLFISFILDK